VADQVEYCIDARLGGLFHPTRDLGLAHQVGLEHQPETLAVVVDEVEERLHRCADALPVVGGRAQRLTDAGDENVDVVLQDRAIQFELAGKMLVEHRFADTGALRDLVHSGRVVAVRDEYFAGGTEQLGTAFVARHPSASLGSAR
jgi:hypothetical protein